MSSTTTPDWKVDEKALIETYGPDGPTGQWHLAMIVKIAWGGPYGPVYHLHCHDTICQRTSRFLKRPTPTEPATCHKVSRMVGIHVRIDPPSGIREVTDDTLTDRVVVLNAWAKDFCDLLRHVRGGDLAGPGPKHAITIERDEQDQCSACGKEWHPQSYPGRDERHCLYCQARVETTEPTP